MTLTHEQRNALLDGYRELHQIWRSGGDPSRGVGADDAKALREGRRMEYFEGLPVVTMSRCPYCDQKVVSQFDPWGLDGFWWQERELGASRAPLGCSHFRLLTGALSLQGHPPVGGEYPAHPGPDIPYVVPKILEQGDAVAVIASLPMSNGYLAYPIAYFSTTDVNAAALAPTWRRTTCSFTTNDGSTAWTPRVAPWEFDLSDWVTRRKIRWIATDDEAMPLAEMRPCPYVDLPGERMNQVIKLDRLRQVGPPTGDALEPFSP